MSTTAEATFTVQGMVSRIRLAGWTVRTTAGLREIAPYAAIEILLPGGSLLALLLWLYRRHKVAEFVARKWRPFESGLRASFSDMKTGRVTLTSNFSAAANKGESNRAL